MNGLLKFYTLNISMCTDNSDSTADLRFVLILFMIFISLIVSISLYETYIGVEYTTEITMSCIDISQNICEGYDKELYSIVRQSSYEFDINCINTYATLEYRNENVSEGLYDNHADNGDLFYGIYLYRVEMVC